MTVVASLRRTVWTVLVVTGTVAFGAALVPDVGTRLPVAMVVSRLGNDYFLLGTFGVLAVGILLWMVTRRARGRIEQASPPDPETVPDTPRPGDWIDETLSQWPGTLDDTDREQLRTQLRTTAIRAEMGSGTSRETARQRVTTGAWTDNATAAQFLNPDASSPSLARQFLMAISGDSWTQVGARAVITELATGSDNQ